MSQTRLLHHLEKLIAFYPKSSDQAAVLKLLEYCKEILDKSGVFPDVNIHKNKGFYSLTASTQKTKQPKLLLEAHIDVVPATGKPSFQLDKKTGTMTGRGVYDMLFGTACYLAFIEEHQAELKDLDVGLMLTGDEEIGGCDGVCYLLEQGYGADVCFLPDAGNGFGDLSIAAKGVYNFDLVAHGKAHHGSRPWEGDGAANKLVLLLHELLGEFDHSDRQNSTMTVTRLNCGDADNQGPNKATAHLDIRYKDTMEYERIKQLVEKLCADYGAEVQNVLQANSLTLDIDHPRIRDFVDLYEKHVGRPVTFSKAHGGSDARFFAAQGIPVIMIRPDGSGAHSDHEILSLASLLQFYQLLEAYIVKTAPVA